MNVVLDGLIEAIDQAVSKGCEESRIRSRIAHANRYSWDRTALEMLEVYRELSGRAA